MSCYKYNSIHELNVTMTANDIYPSDCMGMDDGLVTSGCIWNIKNIKR